MNRYCRRACLTMATSVLLSPAELTSVLLLALVLASPSAGQAQEPTVLLPSERCSDQPDGAIATFEDANLEAEIRAALSVRDQGDLTCGKLSGLLDLRAGNAGIESLVGIQNLTNVTDLFLVNNSIVELGALDDLTSLRMLNLYGNSVTDVGPLGELTSLTHLWLTYNPIGDIRALSGLTSLTYLSLTGVPITDISALSGLASLRDLHVAYTPISDVGALSELTGLEVLGLDNTSIVDISALSGLTSLTDGELQGEGQRRANRVCRDQHRYSRCRSLR